MLYASQVAIRTHQETKLSALRNAVINTAMQIDIGEDVEHMFLNLIDTFTALHLRILEFLHDLVEWAKRLGITYPNWAAAGAANALEIAIPELSGNRGYTIKSLRICTCVD